MKRLTYTSVVVLLLGASLFSCRSSGHSSDTRESTGSAAVAASNANALGFTAMDLDGKPFDGRTLKGKTILLDFWAVWCKPCLAAFPALKRLNRDFARRNFEVVGMAVYSGTPADVKKVVKEHGVDYRVLVGDEALVKRFGVIGYPSYFLVRPDGTIYKKYVGEVPDLYETIAAALDTVQLQAQPQN